MWSIARRNLLIAWAMLTNGLIHLRTVSFPSFPGCRHNGQFGIRIITEISRLVYRFLFGISVILFTVSSSGAFRSLHLPLCCCDRFTLTTSEILSSNWRKICQIVHLEILNRGASSSIAYLGRSWRLTLSFCTFSPNFTLNRVSSFCLFSRLFYAENALAGSPEIGGFLAHLMIFENSQLTRVCPISNPGLIQIRSIDSFMENIKAKKFVF